MWKGMVRGWDVRVYVQEERRSDKKERSKESEVGESKSKMAFYTFGPNPGKLFTTPPSLRYRDQRGDKRAASRRSFGETSGWDMNWHEGVE